MDEQNQAQDQANTQAQAMTILDAARMVITNECADAQEASFCAGDYASWIEAGIAWGAATAAKGETVEQAVVGWAKQCLMDQHESHDDGEDEDSIYCWLPWYGGPEGKAQLDAEWREALDLLGWTPKGPKKEEGQ